MHLSAARFWAPLGLALVACTPDPPEGTFVCSDASDCPEGFVCRLDGMCWRTPEEGVDAGRLDGGRADAAPIDATVPDARVPDATLDAGPGDAGCMGMTAFDVAADALTVIEYPTQSHGTERILNINVTLGPIVLEVSPAADVSTASSLTLRLYGVTCSVACGGTDHRCDTHLREPGTMRLYALRRRFQEPSATFGQSQSGMPWTIGEGGSERGPLLATASFGLDDDYVDFEIPAGATGTVSMIGTMAFLVDADPGNPGVYVARAHEASGPDSACPGESPLPLLIAHTCP